MDRISELLREKGIDRETFHGGMEQDEREVVFVVHELEKDWASTKLISIPERQVPQRFREDHAPSRELALFLARYYQENGPEFGFGLGPLERGDSNLSIEENNCSYRPERIVSRIVAVGLNYKLEDLHASQQDT